MRRHKRQWVFCLLLVLVFIGGTYFTHLFHGDNGYATLVSGDVAAALSRANESQAEWADFPQRYISRLRSPCWYEAVTDAESRYRTNWYMTKYSVSLEIQSEMYQAGRANNKSQSVEADISNMIKNHMVLRVKKLKKYLTDRASKMAKSRWRRGVQLRCLPAAYLVGGSKCGTSSLYDQVVSHPQVRTAAVKENKWFRDSAIHKENRDPIPLADFIGDE